MADERSRPPVPLTNQRTGIAQERRQDDQSIGIAGDNEPVSARPTKGRVLLIGALACVSVAAVGTTVLNMQRSGTLGSMEFVVIDDPQKIIDFIHEQDLPPATAQVREEQAKRNELVVWKIRQYPGFSGQEGEGFTIDNGFDVHSYTITSSGQVFGVFAEKTTNAFRFSAGANPTNGRMTGIWSTSAGKINYNMQTGDSIVVKLK